MNAVRWLRLCSLRLIALARGTPQKYTYWVEPCTQASVDVSPAIRNWRIGRSSLAERGARSVAFYAREGSEHARIRLYWASAELGLYGETPAILVDGKRARRFMSCPRRLRTNGDQLLRDAIVYLTCLHETGHALGLSHTAVFDDIMYSFQYGGDIPEYFGALPSKAAVAR